MPRSTTDYRLWLLLVVAGVASLLVAVQWFPPVPTPPLQLIAVPIPIDEDLGMITSIVSNGWDGLVITERQGRILNVTLSEPPQIGVIADMREQVWDDYSEYGMYSVALSPTYRTNHTLYVSFSNKAGDLEIGRYHTNSHTYQVVLVVPQPRTGDPTVDSTHKGGQLAFYMGYLYISTGDGGTRHPPQDTPAQDPTSLLGKILRIDVETGDPLTYTIPADNPFVASTTTAPEIWAMGLRNPWKFSFDTLTGDMYIADVGDTNFEEINVLRVGENGVNFGWNCYEGDTAYYDGSYCGSNNFQLPIVQYPTHFVFEGRTHCAVAGGYVLDSDKYPPLGEFFLTHSDRAYVFGDVCGARLFYLSAGMDAWDIMPLYTFPDPTRDIITALGVHHRTLYVANHHGDIYEMVMR